jgi:diaminohydroxyphosphoribosylaminopyrimidine deaminase/5-amino-6-(5-phosphoribosylamino)uracil reductase
VQRTESDHIHLARAIELAERGSGRVSPNPLVGGRRRARRDGPWGGLARRVRRPARRGQRDRRLRRRDLRGATLYVSLEPCCHHGHQPPCTEAILDAGIARSSSAATTRARRPPAAASGILRDEGVEVEVPGGELATRARLQNQAFRKHARTGRPARRLQVGDEPRRQGRHAGRRLEVDLERGQPRGRATAGARRSTPSPSASAPRSPTTRSSPRASTASTASRAASCSTRPRACRSTRSSSAEAPEVAARRRRRPRAAPRGATDALETAGAEVIVATGQNEPARICSALDQLGALDPPVTSVLLEGGPHLAGSFMDAARSTRCRLFIAPLVLGGRTARDPLEGEGVDRVADALRALTLDVRAARGRRARHRAAPGVVTAVHGARRRPGNGRRGRRNVGRRAARVHTALARDLADGDSIAVNGVCLTAVGADADGFGADVMHETLRRSSLVEVRPGRG